MPIVGHNETLPLVDLVQNKASEPGSHRFTIEGSKGAGLLVIEGGRVVHAEYGDATGEDAAVELLTERSTYYLVRSGSEIKQRTMNVALGQLLLAADIPDASQAGGGRPAPDVESGYSGPHSVTSMRRADVAKATAEAKQRAPENVHEFPSPTRADGPSEASAAATVRKAATAKPESSNAKLTPVLLAIGAVLVLAAVAFFTLRGSSGSSAPAPEPIVSTPRPSEDGALEVSDLGPQDQAPTLLVGDPAPTPDGTGAVLSPTITCRILVNAQGQVQQAEVYRSRPDLAPFEQAALEAVRSYEFEPARVAGQPRSVWINYPVRFTNS